MMEKLSAYCSFVPSNDIEGDCGTTLALRFESNEQAKRFSENPNIRGTVPINTGKHIYTNWTPIMNKIGALNPLMDPFKMEANRDILPDYRLDMCPNTLDLLARSVYINVSPDWSKEYMDQFADKIKQCLGEVTD